MNVLVTGATGFIGRHVVTALKKGDASVHCLLRKDSFADHSFLDGTKIVRGDITDPASLQQAVAGMDHIYHLAIARTPADSAACMLVNYGGTKNLIQATAQYDPGCRRFIYVSSLAAAGFSPGKNPIDESFLPQPITAYGISKLKGEEAVLEYKKTVPVVILRPPTVIGDNNMLLAHIRRLLSRRIRLSWEGTTSLCYIKDLVSGLFCAAVNPAAVSQIYYISDNKTYSWREIVAALAAYHKKPTLPLYLPLWLIKTGAPCLAAAAQITGRPQLMNKIKELTHPHWLCDSSKIKNELGFNCAFDLYSGLKDWLGEKNDNRR